MLNRFGRETLRPLVGRSVSVGMQSTVVQIRIQIADQQALFLFGNRVPVKPHAAVGVEKFQQVFAVDQIDQREYAGKQDAKHCVKR